MNAVLKDSWYKSIRAVAVNVPINKTTAAVMSITLRAVNKCFIIDKF